MKSLLEVQEEIKNVEAALVAMSNTVKGINDDIQSLREMNDESDLDYDRIRLMAKKVPFPSHPLGELDDRLVVRLYIQLLLCVVSLNREATMEKLTFIQWMITAAGMDEDIEDLFRECQKLDGKILNNAAEFIPDDYKIHLIVDALMTAKINGETNSEVMEFIADLCIVLGIKKDIAEICALLSRVFLTQSKEDIEAEKVENLMPYLDKMDYYISVPERELVVCVPENESSEFSWLAEKGSEVNKGEAIAAYEMFYPMYYKCIETPVSGTFFGFKNGLGVKTYKLITHYS